MCPCNQVESDRATVLDVKKVLAVRCGIPTYQQSLVMAGRALTGILTRLVDPSPSLLLWPCRSLSLSLAVAVSIPLPLSCCGRIYSPVSSRSTVIAVAEVFPQIPSKMHKSPLSVCVKQWLKFSLPALSPDSERLCDCNIKTGTRLFLAQKSLSAPPPSAPPPSTPPSVWTHKTTQFWAQLSSFLLQHFSPADTKKIVHKMEEVSEQHKFSRHFVMF